MLGFSLEIVLLSFVCHGLVELFGFSGFVKFGLAQLAIVVPSIALGSNILSIYQ